MQQELTGVGVGRRAVAVIVDMILISVVGYLLAMVTGQTEGAGFELTGLPALIYIVAAFAYFVYMEANGGATVGKRALGLKVVTEGGGAIDMRASVIRNLLRIVDGFLFYLVAAILVWTSSRNQRLGDRLAHTLVVRADAGVEQAGTPQA